MTPFRYQYIVTVRGSRPFPHEVLRVVNGDFATLADQINADDEVTRSIHVRAVHIDEHHWRAHGAEITHIERLAT